MAIWTQPKVNPTDNLKNYKLTERLAALHAQENDGGKSWSGNGESAFDIPVPSTTAKADPDASTTGASTNTAQLQSHGLHQRLVAEAQKGLVRGVEVQRHCRNQLDRLHEKRLVAPQRYGIVPTGWGGANAGCRRLCRMHVADYLCDGKPFNAWLKAKGLLRLDVGKLENRLKIRCSTGIFQRTRRRAGV